MNIKILGLGCAKCDLLEKNIRKVVESLNINATIEKVEDDDQILSYGIMRTPGLVIDEKVMSAGRVLYTQEIERLLKAHI